MPGPETVRDLPVELAVWIRCGQIVCEVIVEQATSIIRFVVGCVTVLAPCQAVFGDMEALRGCEGEDGEEEEISKRGGKFHVKGGLLGADCAAKN